MGPNDMISRKRRAPPSFTLVIEKKDTVAMLRQENPIKLLDEVSKIFLLSGSLKETTTDR